MNIRVIYIIFLSTLFLYSCKKSNEQLFDEAYTLLQNDQYDKAINLYTDLIKRNSKFQLAYYNRGYCYYSQKNYKSALFDFNKLIDLQTIGGFIYTQNSNGPFSNEESKFQVPYYDALYQRAQVNFYLERNNESFQDFSSLVVNNYEEKSNCYLWLGSIFINSGDTLKACDCYNNAQKYSNKEAIEKEAGKFIDLYCVKHN